MTELIRELNETRVGRLRLLHLLLAALLAAAVGVSALGAARPAHRQVTLVARDMAFYLPGDPTPNPILHLAPGETLEITLRNDDPGMTHDFAVGSLGISSPTLRRGGTAASFLLEAPGVAGSHEYICSYHPVLMRGTLLVR